MTKINEKEKIAFLNLRLNKLVESEDFKKSSQEEQTKMIDQVFIKWEEMK